MKKFAEKANMEGSPAPLNCVAIMALVTEMARRLNENIAKVQLKPLPESLGAADMKDVVLTGTETYKG